MSATSACCCGTRRGRLTTTQSPGCRTSGWGLPVIGAARIRAALANTAQLLEALGSQTLEVMNAGGGLDDAIHAIRAPAQLLKRPYLRPAWPGTWHSSLSWPSQAIRRSHRPGTESSRSAPTWPA